MAARAEAGGAGSGPVGPSRFADLIARAAEAGTGIVGGAADGHFMAAVFRVATLKDGGATVILPVSYAEAAAASTCNASSAAGPWRR